VTLQWNRPAPPLPADCRGAWAAAYRDRSRRLPERIHWICRGAWRPIVRAYCSGVGKELR
jgi:hypothetical protein